MEFRCGKADQKMTLSHFSTCFYRIMQLYLRKNRKLSKCLHKTKYFCFCFCFRFLQIIPEKPKEEVKTKTKTKLTRRHALRDRDRVHTTKEYDSAYSMLWVAVLLTFGGHCVEP